MDTLLIEIDEYVSLVANKFIDNATFISLERANAIQRCKDWDKYCHLEYNVGQGGNLVKLYTIQRWKELNRQAIASEQRKAYDGMFAYEAKRNMSVLLAIQKIRENKREYYDACGGSQVLKQQLEMIQIIDGDESLMSKEDIALVNYLKSINIEIV